MVHKGGWESKTSKNCEHGLWTTPKGGTIIYFENDFLNSVKQWSAL